MNDTILVITGIVVVHRLRQTHDITETAPQTALPLSPLPYEANISLNLQLSAAE